jgi:MerR family transcriptional regulator, redox-sensitive transcriptional activator SoxR
VTIGQIARKSGLRASAIRFYERSGLIPKPSRVSGQRRYDDRVLDCLVLIEFAKGCGFTLDEIRQLFGGFRDRAPVLGRVRDLAERKIQELDALISHAEVMKATLARAQRCRCVDVEECARRIRGLGEC